MFIYCISVNYNNYNGSNFQKSTNIMIIIEISKVLPIYYLVLKYDIKLGIKKTRVNQIRVHNDLFDIWKDKLNNFL